MNSIAVRGQGGPAPNIFPEFPIATDSIRLLNAILFAPSGEDGQCPMSLCVNGPEQQFALENCPREIMTASPADREANSPARYVAKQCRMSRWRSNSSSTVLTQHLG